MEKIFLAVILIFATFVSGCGLGPIGTNEPGGPVLYSFTDVTGRKLEFRQKPRRIVSLNNSVDEILLDLVEHDRIAALTHLADDPTLCCAYEKAKNVHGRARASNMEQVVRLGSDVVIVADWVGNDYINSLRQYGLKMAVLRTPENYAEIVQFIRDVAFVVGESRLGERMVQNLQRRAAHFRRKAVAAYGEKNLRTVLALSTMGMMGQKGTFNDICYWAGVKNAMADVDVPQGVVVSEEKILAINPDVLILPSWDYYKSRDFGEMRDRIVNNPIYKNTKAVRQGRVCQVHDQYLYSTSQYAVKAVEEMAKVTYPELY